MDIDTPRRRRHTGDSRHPLCPVCGHIFKYRAKRNILVRVFLFWLPVKRYFCTTCLVCRHIFFPRFEE